MAAGGGPARARDSSSPAGRRWTPARSPRGPGAAPLGAAGRALEPRCPPHAGLHPRRARPFCRRSRPDPPRGPIVSLRPVGRRSPVLTLESVLKQLKKKPVPFPAFVLLRVTTACRTGVTFHFLAAASVLLRGCARAPRHACDGGRVAAAQPHPGCRRLPRGPAVWAGRSPQGTWKLTHF